MRLVVRELEPGFLVSGQPEVAQLAALADGGVVRLLCLRPDDEEGDYPDAATLAAAAARLGLAFTGAPVRGLDVTDAALAAVDAALDAGGPTLAWCRSGRRVALAWVLARRRRGDAVPALIDAARAAGHDLAGLVDAPPVGAGPD